ncbi:MAG: hypothetical protein ACO3JG_09235 [Luteolibacter sp.]
MKNIAISTITMISLALLAPAAEPKAAPEAKPAAEVANGNDAKQLEQQVMGYWAPDAEAMVKLLVEKMGMPEEDGQAVSEQFSKITFHVELGKVHVYTEEGVMDVAYEILAADGAAGSLTVRAVNPDPANKKQALELLIKDQQITVKGGEEQLPFILKKIDEAEFAKRKAAVPADRIGG